MVLATSSVVTDTYDREHIILEGGLPWEHFNLSLPIVRALSHGWVWAVSCSTSLLTFSISAQVWSNCSVASPSCWRTASSSSPTVCASAAIARTAFLVALHLDISQHSSYSSTAAWLSGNPPPSLPPTRNVLNE